jgi:hypothetical protein
MKNKLLTFAGALALLATLGHFYAKPLLAQVRAALVQNMDEPGRHPYQVRIGFDTAQGFAADFPDVPVGQRLVVQQIMVESEVPNNLFGALQLSVGTTVVFQDVLHTDTESGLRTRQLSTPLTAYVDGGQHAEVFFILQPRPSFVNITLIGHLIDCSVAGSCAAIVQ